MRRSYTHPSVYEGIRQGADWADPEMDPTRIDWAPRQAAALIPFRLDEHGPVNPVEDTDVRLGRNFFGHWGEQPCGDAWVTAIWNGIPHLLMVERGGDNEQAGDRSWALPGGYVDVARGEDPRTPAAAIRELEEETGLALPGAVWRSEDPRYIPDPRASRQSWPVTVLSRTDLGTVDRLPTVRGRDDARRAAWIRAGSYEDLAACLTDT